MKQLVVLSGKGGTGKTSITASLAHLASRKMPLSLVDADVDASNLELLLSPEQEESRPFFAGQVASIDPDRCTSCGVCREVCRFDAVREEGRGERKRYWIDSTACEGCAACYHQCAEGAIRTKLRQVGHWFRSRTFCGILFHARLFAGQENSGKLVSHIRQEARRFAEQTGSRLLLVDGPPGISCPVIASTSGSDLALVVTEPSVSAFSDLGRILETLSHFRIRAAVAINKFDLNRKRADEIEALCRSNGIEVLARIPFDPLVSQAMVRALPVTVYSENGVSSSISALWERLRRAGNDCR